MVKRRKSIKLKLVSSHAPVANPPDAGNGITCTTGGLVKQKGVPFESALEGIAVPRKCRSKSSRVGHGAQTAVGAGLPGGSSHGMPILSHEVAAAELAPAGEDDQGAAPSALDIRAGSRLHREAGTSSSEPQQTPAALTTAADSKPLSHHELQSESQQESNPANSICQPTSNHRQLRQLRTAVTEQALPKHTHMSSLQKSTAANESKKRSRHNGKQEDSTNSDDDDGQLDILMGCPSCNFSSAGCQNCEYDPLYVRPKQRWKPELGRHQDGIEDAPTFYPTAEEFKDPFAYISKIRPEAEKFGLCCIVPPDDFKPPFALEKGSNGVNADSFQFHIRKQPTSMLCVRDAAQDTSSRPEQGAPKGPVKYGRVRRTGDKHCSMPNKDFGFVYLDEPMTYKEFAAITDWVKQQHFSKPTPKGMDPPPKKLKVYHYKGPSPSVEEVEAEFWRVIENPDEPLESLYGQDVDSGHMGSGFPLPGFRLQKLEERLASQKETSTSGTVFKKPRDSAEDRKYRYHKWNINNLPRAQGSVLRHVVNDELITGVMVPWLYIGSCLSAFCWHVEDHGFYSINYMHMGAAKVWYGVPGHAAGALEDAMRDAVPHLFESQPQLMYQLVTMVSPKELKARGVPVYRMVHREGSFVITMPNAYHGGFNTGFNCAEAVNFAPADWIPWGTELAEKYRKDGKPLTLSFDALLVTLVKAAEKQEPAWKQARVAAGLRPRKRPDAPTVGEEPDIQEESLDSVPVEAIRLAAGELALRVKEERRRREAGLSEGPVIEIQRMRGAKHGRHPRGFFLNTEDTDCEFCKCDLYLSAVVSPQVPDQAVCPEHADKLGCDPATLVLLYRYTLEELAGMLAVAIDNVEGTEEAIREATQRKQKLQDMAVKINPLGPMSGSKTVGRSGKAPRRNALQTDVPGATEDVPDAVVSEGMEYKDEATERGPSEPATTSGAVDLHESRLLKPVSVTLGKRKPQAKDMGMVTTTAHDVSASDAAQPVASEPPEVKETVLDSKRVAPPEVKETVLDPKRVVVVGLGKSQRVVKKKLKKRRTGKLSLVKRQSSFHRLKPPGTKRMESAPPPEAAKPEPMEVADGDQQEAGTHGPDVAVEDEVPAGTPPDGAVEDELPAGTLPDGAVEDELPAGSLSDVAVENELPATQTTAPSQVTPEATPVAPTPSSSAMVPPPVMQQDTSRSSSSIQSLPSSHASEKHVGACPASVSFVTVESQPPAPLSHPVSIPPLPARPLVAPKAPCLPAEVPSVSPPVMSLPLAAAVKPQGQRMSDKLAEWLERPRTSGCKAAEPSPCCSVPQAPAVPDAVLGPRFPDGLQLLKLLASQDRSSVAGDRALSGDAKARHPSATVPASKGTAIDRLAGAESAGAGHAIQDGSCTAGHSDSTPLPDSCTALASSSPGAVATDLRNSAVRPDGAVPAADASVLPSSSARDCCTPVCPPAPASDHKSCAAAEPPAGSEPASAMFAGPMSLDKLAELLEEQGVPAPVELFKQTAAVAGWQDGREAPEAPACNVDSAPGATQGGGTPAGEVGWGDLTGSMHPTTSGCGKDSADEKHSHASDVTMVEEGGEVGGSGDKGVDSTTGLACLAVGGVSEEASGHIAKGGGLGSMGSTQCSGEALNAAKPVTVVESSPATVT